MHHHRLLASAAGLGFSLLTAACAPADVDGSWSGTWNASLSTADGSLSLDLSQDGDAVEGTFQIGGTWCVGSGSVEGNVDGRGVDLALINGVGGEIQLKGTVGAGDKNISGDFNVVDGLCEDASGRFSIDRE